MYIADLKNKKASLETSVERAQRDVDKLAEPQVGDIKLTKRFGQLGLELFWGSVVNTADWFRLRQKRRVFRCPPIAAHADNPNNQSNLEANTCSWYQTQEITCWQVTDWDGSTPASSLRGWLPYGGYGGAYKRDKLGAWLRFYLTRPKRDCSKTGN